MVIMSLDPGDKNFAITILSLRKKRKPSILYTGVYDSLNPNPNDIETIKSILRYLHKLRKKYKVRTITCERYQNRGVRSQMVESVSMLIGAMYQSFRKKDVEIIVVTALKWKNYVNGTTKVDRARSEKRMKEWYKETFATNHQQDALLLALFCVDKERLIKFRRRPKARTKLWVALERKAKTSDKPKPRGLKRRYGKTT